MRSCAAAATRPLSTIALSPKDSCAFGQRSNKSDRPVRRVTPPTIRVWWARAFCVSDLRSLRDAVRLWRAPVDGPELDAEPVRMPPLRGLLGDRGTVQLPSPPNARRRVLTHHERGHGRSVPSCRWFGRWRNRGLLFESCACYRILIMLATDGTPAGLSRKSMYAPGGAILLLGGSFTVRSLIVAPRISRPM